MKVPLYVTDDLRNTPVSSIELSNRCVNGLLRMDYTTIGDIIDRWEELPDIRGLGTNSVNEIKNAVVNESLAFLSEEQVQDFLFTLLLRNSAENLRKVFSKHAAAEG